MFIFRKANVCYDYLVTRQDKLTSLFFYFFLLILLITRIAIVFCYQGHLAGIDNNFDYPVMRLLKSLSIYPNPEDYPFAVNPYGPLFFYVAYFFCFLLGVDAGDGIQIFFVTRGLCVVYDLITIFLLYRILRHYLSISRPVASIAVLCFFYLISYWGYTMNRSDSLILLIFSVLVYLLIKHSAQMSYRLVFILALLCNLAIFTKQNTIILPVLISIILGWHFKWKQLAAYLFFLALLFSASLLFFNQLYPNGTFFAHLVKAINNRIDFQWFYVEMFKRITSGYAIIPLGAGIFLSVHWLLKKPLQQPLILPIAAIVMTCWGLLIALKWGSHPGYLHEGFFCITVILAVYINQPGNRQFFQKTILPVLFILLFILANIVLQFYFFYLNNRSTDKKSYAAQKEVADYLLAETNGKDVFVFASTNLYGDFFKVLLQEKAVNPNEDAVSCCTLPDESFNYKKLEEGFTNGKIAFIIFQQGSVSNRYHHISFDKYQYVKTINGYLIYRFAD